MAEPLQESAGREAGGLELEPEQRRKVEELAERLALYRAKYYAGEPLVSDAAYDALEDELRGLDPTHPILGLVGTSTLVGPWQEARHEIPMGSLNKVVSVEELREWLARCDELLAKQGAPPIDSELSVTEKLDGLSVELIYRDGRFVDGITRGDGEIGERITPNVALMRGVRASIPDTRPLSVRGEILLRLTDAREHFPPGRTPRNTAAGHARSINREFRLRLPFLSVLVYDLMGAPEVATEHGRLVLLRRLGFSTPLAYLGSVDEVIAWHRRYSEELRDNSDYEIDGLVVRANRIDAQVRLGELNHRPRGAVAFKFASPSKVSRVLEIRWDTGSSGRVTPVAVVEPVMLAGATVQRASLHNASLVRELDIGVGDEVLISRRNDVIPYVEEVVEKHGSAAKPPKDCGRCHQPLQAEGEYLFCRNAQCPGLLEGRIHNWIDAMGALEWGDKLVEQLVERGLVREPLDLYSLAVEDVASLEREGRKKGRKVAERALAELRARLPLTLPVFLAALGIEGFGLQTARLLIGAGYRDLDRLLEASEAEIGAIRGLGGIKAATIVRGLRTRADEIQRLLDAGIRPEALAEAGPLAGKTFCITGTHSRPRKELGALIEQRGGRLLSSVTQALDYLVIADPASTSSKAVKARQYGTKLLSEAELIGLLGVARA
jgi:DNA ligase (NAD+)